MRFPIGHTPATKCRHCGRRLWGDDEKERGVCVPCHERRGEHRAPPPEQRVLGSPPVTRCRQCGQRLWAADEREVGLCVPCRWKSRSSESAAHGTSFPVLAADPDPARAAADRWGRPGEPKRAKVVVGLLWFLATITGLVATIVGVPVVWAIGTRQGVDSGQLVVLAITLSLAALNGRAALAFSRFRGWAWWYAVLLLGLGSAIGLLGFLAAEEGEGGGSLILGLVFVSMLIGALSIRARFRRRARASR